MNKKAENDLPAVSDRNLPGEGSPETGVTTSREQLARELAPVYKQVGDILAPGLNLGQMDIDDIADRFVALLNHPVFDEAEIRREIDFLPWTKRGLTLLADMDKLLKNNAANVSPEDADVIREEYPQLVDLMQQASMGYHEKTISEADKDFAENFIKEKIEALEPVVAPYTDLLLGGPIVDEQDGQEQLRLEDMSGDVTAEIKTKHVRANGVRSDDQWILKDIKFLDFTDAVGDLVSAAKSSGIKTIVLADSSIYTREVIPLNGLKKTTASGEINKKIGGLRGIVRTAFNHPRWYKSNEIKVVFCL